jgi:gamma-glutamyltranspeptidase/glutathione hydrolase
MPIERLTSKAYAKTLAKTIDPEHASSSVELGKDIVGQIASDEHEETTQFSIVDKNGNAVSNTYTLEGGFGSHVVVGGAGFILNNEMGDFNKKPGETNLTGDIGTPANVIAPGKRMLSSMSPTIVTKNGKLFMVTGSPGGRTIINTVMEIVLNGLAFGMDARQAVDAPRFHHQWLPDEVTFERNAIPDSTAQRLEAMGHKLRFGGQQGDGHTIILRDGVAYGANDRRSADRARGALELPFLHDLEEVVPFEIFVGLRPAGDVERRIVSLALWRLGLRRFGHGLLHELGELLIVHSQDPRRN